MVAIKPSASSNKFRFCISVADQAPGDGHPYKSIEFSGLACGSRHLHETALADLLRQLKGEARIERAE
jgi:hypothetical protein